MGHYIISELLGLSTEFCVISYFIHSICKMLSFLFLLVLSQNKNSPSEVPDWPNSSVVSSMLGFCLQLGDLLLARLFVLGLS